jgi:pilus assembly protein Flp/PilA
VYSKKIRAAELTLVKLLSSRNKSERKGISFEIIQLGTRKKAMNTLKLIKNFVRNEDGATAIEYSLIAALIGVAIIGGAGALGNNINQAYTNIGGKLKVN